MAAFIVVDRMTLLSPRMWIADCVRAGVRSETASAHWTATLERSAWDQSSKGNRA